MERWGEQRKTGGGHTEVGGGQRGQAVRECSIRQVPGGKEGPTGHRLVRAERSKRRAELPGTPQMPQLTHLMVERALAWQHGGGAAWWRHLDTHQLLTALLPLAWEMRGHTRGGGNGLGLRDHTGIACCWGLVLIG